MENPGSLCPALPRHQPGCGTQAAQERPAPGSPQAGPVLRGLHMHFLLRFPALFISSSAGPSFIPQTHQEATARREDTKLSLPSGVTLSKKQDKEAASTGCAGRPEGLVPVSVPPNARADLQRGTPSPHAEYLVRA